MPGAYSNENSNANRKQRINDCPACQENGDTGNDNTYRYPNISKDMQHSGAHIQIIGFLLQAKANDEIDHDTNSCSHKHNERLNRFWMLETLYSLQQNGESNHNQRHSIHHCCQNTNTMITKGFTCIW